MKGENMGRNRSKVKKVWIVRTYHKMVQSLSHRGSKAGIVKAKNGIAEEKESYQGRIRKEKIF